MTISLLGAAVIVEKADGTGEGDVGKLDPHDLDAPTDSPFVAGIREMSAELGCAYLVKCSGHDGLRYLCYRRVFYRVLDMLDLKDGTLYVLNSSSNNPGDDYRAAIARSEALSVQVVRTRDDVICVSALR